MAHTGDAFRQIGLVFDGKAADGKVIVLIYDCVDSWVERHGSVEIGNWSVVE